MADETDEAPEVPADEPGAPEVPADETDESGVPADEPVAPQPAAPQSPAPEPAAPAKTPSAESRPNLRKVREGIVVSVAMDKTAVVGVVDRVRHPRYAKTVQRTKKLYAHDEANDLRVGDRVRLTETRPLSKLKRWRVVEVLERAK